MALGNDLDSKIVEIYQEYLKHQKDEKIANRVYASEESFRNGLEEVIKLNGIVDKSEFYTAIAFEIQNGNFSISNDGKIDLASESITKAVERAKEAENKKIKVNSTNEEESKKVPIEKGILGITEIKTMEDAQRVLSARIKISDMTPEKKKLTKDAMAFALSEVMDETTAAEIADEVVELATAPKDVPPEKVSTMLPPTIGIIDDELIAAVANSSLIPNNIQEQDRIWAAVDLIVRLGDGVDQTKMKHITDEIIKFSNKCSEMNINMPWTIFVKSGDTFHPEYMTDLTRRLFALKDGGRLNAEEVQVAVNGVLEQMEADGIEVTPEMRTEATKIVINPECVTKQIVDDRAARQQMLDNITRTAPGIFTTFFNQYENTNALTSEQKYTIEQKAMLSRYITVQGRDGKVDTQGGIVKGTERTIPVTESQLGIDTGELGFIDNVVDPQMVHGVGIEKFDFSPAYGKKYGDYKMQGVHEIGHKQKTTEKKIAGIEFDDDATVDVDNDSGDTHILVDKTILGRDEAEVAAQDAGMEAIASEFGMSGDIDDVFAAMFGSGKTEELQFDGIEVEHDHDVEGDGEMVEDAPIGAAAASGLVAEDVVIGEVAPKVNEVQTPPVINESIAEVVEETEVPEQGNGQSNLPKVVTWADKIKQSLADLGKKAKEMFGKIAGMFGGGSNDAGNNTGTNGTGGIVQDAKPPKPSQAPAYDPLKQQFKLNYDYAKNASTEKGSDPSKPKGVDDPTQGHEMDDI